jgi:hypothetical protein
LVTPLEDTSVEEIIETGPVFSKVRDTWCSVLTVIKCKPSANSMVQHKKISRFIVSAEERLRKFARGEWDIETEIPQSYWLKNRKMIVSYLASVKEQELIDNIESNSVPLGELSSKYRISRGEEGSKFALKEQLDGNSFMVIPENVERYSVDQGMKISEAAFSLVKLGAIYKHPKIWIIRIQKLRWETRLVCGLDKRLNSGGMKTLQVVVSTTDDLQELKYLLAILSSSLINFWCVNYLADDMNKAYLEKLPIRAVNLDDPKDKAKHDRIVSLVEQMLSLHERLADAKMASDKKTIEQQIKATDRQIDQLVYELYELTEEEIAIVEGK